MKKLTLTLVLFSVIFFNILARESKSVKEKEVVEPVAEAVAVEEPTAVIPEDENINKEAAIPEEAPAVKECPFKRIAYSEVKDGETYLVVKKYVKGENDAEDINPETIVVLKPVQNIYNDERFY